jgi:MFS family permease
MVLSQLVMVAIMTMTPVHMHDHGHSTAASGLVIALHVGAMYLPSPLTGALTDCYGPTAVAAASGLTLLAAGVLAAAAPADSVLLPDLRRPRHLPLGAGQDRARLRSARRDQSAPAPDRQPDAPQPVSPPPLTLALILLGIGWNFGLVSGTTMITDAVPLATRANTQGMVDVAIAIAGATGGMTSGIVVAATSYPLLALTGAAFALALLPAVIVTARKSSPRTPSSVRP